MDQAINYNSILLKVEKTITKLKQIGLNVTEFELEAKEIIKECQEEVASTYKYSISNALNQSAFLEQAYIKASFKLNKLLITMMQYEIYLKIASFTNSLRYFLTKKDKQIDDFIDLRTSLVSLLTKLVNSNTLDYNIEGSLIRDIYQMTYNFIKEEIKATGNSLTLKLLSDNDIHLLNIDALVRKELESMNLKDPKYTRVFERLNKLDEEGIDANYADLELIKEIIYSEVSIEEHLSLIMELESKIKEYLTKAEDLKTSIIKNKESLKASSLSKKEIYQNLSKFLVSLGLSTSILLSLIIASFKIGKSASLIKANLTRHTTFNASTSQITTTEIYEENSKDKVFLKEYNPFIKKGNHYIRTVNIYNLSRINSLPIKEYLELDLSNLGIRKEIKTEEKETLSQEDLYEEPYKIIEKIEVNENDYKIDKYLFNQVFITGVLLFLSPFLYNLYDLFFNVVVINNKKDRLEFAISYSLTKIYKLFKELIDIKKIEEEKKINIKNSKEKLLELIKESKKLITSLEEQIKLIDINDGYEEEKNAFKKVLAKIHDIENF